MPKRKTESWLKHLDFILIDVLCIHMAFLLAYWIRFGYENPYLEREWRNIAIVITLFDLLIIIFGNFLHNVLRRGYLKEIISLIKQITAVELMTAFYLYAIHESAVYSRIVIVFTGLIDILIAMLVRTLWKRFLHRYFLTRKRRVLLIGNGMLAYRFAQLLETDIQSQMKLEVYLSDEPCQDIGCYAGGTALLEQYLKENKADEVVAALGESETKTLFPIVNLCEKYGVRISVIPFYHDVMSSQASIEQIGDVKLLNFRTTPFDNATNAMLKRFFDIFASMALLILASPIMLFVAIGIKVSDPGPVLFRQERVGRNKKTFTMLKFRSMRITGTEDTGWSTDDDPRKTKFGSFIRKYSIDELPQLFNVLAGQMSLIGPRPEVPYHVAHFINEIPMYLVRQQVRPGITGWAQVNGFRGDTSIEERVRYDIWYIENWSISLDCKIIVKTVFGGMVNSERLKTHESRGI